MFILIVTSTIVNNLGQEYRYIVLYVMTWNEAVAKYHKQYLKSIGIAEVHVQTIVLKKTLESVFFEY
ncbi:hypothetical protein PAEPH01_2600 [Pancytospora epiphaga]|nr:hypothetical protein PAEPH01_2600 [Pancytospora epiphaga]